MSLTIRFNGRLFLSLILHIDQSTFKEMKVEKEDRRVPLLILKKISWHRLVYAQFPIIYLHILFLTYWRESLEKNWCVKNEKNR